MIFSELINYNDSNYKTPSALKTEYSLLDVRITDMSALVDRLYEIYVTVTYANGETLNFSERLRYPNTTAIFSSNKFVIKEGKTTVFYEVIRYGIITEIHPTWYYNTYEFTIYGVENKFPLKPWTNEEVIHRVLQLAEPLRKGETPRFSLAETQGVSRRDLDALAPEYTFTRMNLREVMQTIGGTMHAEPRLKMDINDKYTGKWLFEKYGGTRLAEYKNFRTGEIKPLNQYKYTTYKRSHEIEQACTKLDSYMDNLVNRVDWQKATIGKPSEYAWFGSRLRSETAYIRMEENSEETIFTTEFPIDRVESFEAVWRTKDENGNVTGFETVDITPWVYEKLVYNNLSSYASQSPAKAVALYYTQGEKGIKGFFYKVPNATGGVYDNYSVVNVLKSAGYPLNLLLDSKYDGYNYMLLELRITYVPIYSTRIQHGKQYLTDYLPTGRTINYAQGDNSVETRFFGENIKGTAQRLGTVERYVTFIFRHASNIPKAGDLWDSEYYIATIQVSVLRDHFQITCGLSKNFNRKSKYIGANSHKRIYEVSETMVQQRHTLLSDYIVIETEESALYKTVDDYMQGVVDFGVQYLNAEGFDSWTGIFDQKWRSPKVDISEYPPIYSYETSTIGVKTKVQSVNMRAYSYKNEPVQNYSITLPVISSTFGNVIECTCECKDNFSAGLAARRVEWGNNNTGYFTEEVEYGDYYGRAYYLQYNLLSDFRVDDSDNNKLSDASALIPREIRSTLSGSVASTKDFRNNTEKHLLYRKDSRESLKISYLLETIAGDNSIILGSALQHYNPIITNTRPPKPHLYALAREIGKFEDYIDTTAENVYDFGEILTLERDLDFSKYETYAKTRSANYVGTGLPETALSWCIAIPTYNGKSIIVSKEDGSTEGYTPKMGGEILIGRNEKLTYGKSFGKLYMYCVHDIQAYITAKKKASKL